MHVGVTLPQKNDPQDVIELLLCLVGLFVDRHCLVECT